ncbi:MAG: HAMP domain-containing histidine kinase [Candidatus Eremiobacteraeota bacterium]|nr:HAMP domain-containing histidine kinase [Candidatus Eremiobacteraeota bacterium]
MALDTSSPVRERPLTLHALALAIHAEVRVRPVPILVLRLPQFERIAWRHGKRAAQRLERSAARAFMQAARQSLRNQDILAHEPHSDIFAAAIVAGPRRDDSSEPYRIPSALDCRSALERIAAGMSLATELSIETGWTIVRRTDAKLLDLTFDIALALERGQRERERYEFFATVGHELRTPLTSIRGYLETLIEGDMDGATSRRFLETARKEALRLGRLVDNMFEFSLLDLSASSLHSTVCDLSATVAAACAVIAPQAAARAITVRQVITGTTLAGIDEDACTQALVNLLDNAIKYGRDGGCVQLSMRRDPPFVRIAVEDDGPGVAPGDRERIFGLRVRGAQTERPGTGIGLAIVRMIAERAGGEISVMESALGGARFELLLPARAESVTAVS